MNVNTAEVLFSSNINFVSFDHDTEQVARDRFLEYQKTGVIKPASSFDDPVWKTTDEYSNVGLHFKFNEFSYHRNWRAVFGMDLRAFVTCVKVFCLSLFGRTALVSIENTILDLRHMIEMQPEALYGSNTALRFTHPMICSDFFAALPDSVSEKDLNALTDAMESYADICFSTALGNQRTLSDLDTYFTFDQIIRDYWDRDLSAEDRLFYYPLYLWWTFTAVIPLRPREFLLTKRDCLERDSDGNYWLSIRRNNLKGHRNNISYKLSADYKIDRYRIPEKLGKDIQNYIDLTSHYGKTDIDTLFVTDPHYRKWKQRKHNNSRFLTYINMNTILRYFYQEVISGIYGLKILYEAGERHLNDDEIGFIHLGDTRHIALVNLMEEGGTPAVAMMLAGHAGLDTSAHYYSNVKKFIECRTYRQYRKLTDGGVQFKISCPQTLPPARTCHPLSGGGFCSSDKYSSGELSDCLSASGPHGEIAYCPDCRFYRPAPDSGLITKDVHLGNLENDWHELLDSVERVRRGKDAPEDICQALIKLQASSLSYQQYLLEKQMENENT